jgi:hypothetical protein
MRKFIVFIIYEWIIYGILVSPVRIFVAASYHSVYYQQARIRGRDASGARPTYLQDIFEFDREI